MEPALRNSLYGLKFVNTRTNLLGATELLEEAALDKYTFVRDAYLQRRQYLLENGNGPRKLPQYEDAIPTPVKPPSE
jgi:phospholipid-binding lipoprotein MlaA